MQYPRMNTNPSVTLNIPSFNGGINASVAPQDIQDNQAVSVSNMWLKDGSIQTRPALKKGSDNAYFLTESKLVDLGVEVKLGYESYNSDDVALGDSNQHIYRLMFSYDKRFLVYDLIENCFLTVETEFQKDLYETCFNEGKVESHFFYTNGLGDEQLKTGNGYKQTFFTEVYGFMMFSGCPSLENESIKLMFYLSPYISGDSIKLKLEVYNSVKDLPEEHTPYCPTVTLDYGESYGGTLEDFNLMTNASIAQYNINKSLDEMQTTRETAFVDKNFGYGEASATASEEVYGNFDAWERVSFTLPGFNVSYISEAVLYGIFTFYTYKAKHYTIVDITDGSETVFSGTYGELDDQGNGITEKRATATKLKIKYDSIKKKTTCIFYDKDDNVVYPSSNYDTNGHDTKHYCTDNATAEITADKLEIKFPASKCELIVPEKNAEGDWKEVAKEFNTADVFVEQMCVYYYQQGEKGNVEYWDEQNRSELVTRNTLKTWYGGTNSGYAGGTRLFVAGHPELKNVIRWSNVNDSSYFLENNFSYVGRDDEAITALNKQDGYLVVFKERELYALEYTYTTDKDDKAVVYFPITPISPYIGCDCPDTIQLVANRLTWLNSAGKVYTLYSENSYSERNVRELSQHIENELKLYDKEILKKAKSVDYDNNYIIFIDKTAYIWNYDLNPFYNYTSSEQAQKKLSWFKWEFPYPVKNAYNVDGNLVVICNDGYGSHQGYVLDYDGAYDELLVSKSSILSGYKSKLFDFGKPFTFKKINRAFFEVNSKNKGDFYVRFYTDDGTEKNPVILTTTNNTTGCVTYSMRPYLRRVRGAGFELISKVPIKLLSASITAEIYGEVK